MVDDAAGREAEQSGWEAMRPTQGGAVRVPGVALRLAPNHISCLFKGAAFRGKVKRRVIICRLQSMSAATPHPLPLLELPRNTNL